MSDLSALADHIHRLRERLPMFTVYDHPTDYPEGYIARLFLSLPQAEPTPTILVCAKVEPIREQLEALGLVRMQRHPDDDPNIMETWL